MTFNYIGSAPMVKSHNTIGSDETMYNDLTRQVGHMRFYPSL